MFLKVTKSSVHIINTFLLFRKVWVTDLLNDYFRGLFGLYEYYECIEEKEGISELFEGHNMMKTRGRTLECFDDPSDCYPCYSCIQSSLSIQLIQNILESSERKETFDDLLRAMKIEIDGWLKHYVDSITNPEEKRIFQLFLK